MKIRQRRRQEVVVSVCHGRVWMGLFVLCAVHNGTMMGSICIMANRREVGVCVLHMEQIKCPSLSSGSVDKINARVSSQ